MSNRTPYYTLDELAKEYGKTVSPRTLRKAIAAGKLKAIKIGRSWLVKPSDLRVYEQSCGSTPAKEETHKPRRGYVPSEAAIRLFGG